MVEEGASRNGLPLEGGIALLAAGHHRAALEAASDACRAEPTRPEAHYLYGQAWTALGEHARAERAFAEAIRLRPNWADAWVNYGVTRYRQGSVEHAKTAMRQALQAEPGHGPASANLGAFMRITGGGDAAEALLRGVLTHDPDQVGARLNLVADLLSDERPQEALDLLDAVAPPRARDALIHHGLQRSRALLQVHRREEARVALDALDATGPLPRALRPLRLWRDVILAVQDGDHDRAAAVATLMEAALDEAGPSAVPEHRIMAHFDLAKFWSGRGEHGRAFAHWEAGHRLLAQSQPFSRQDHTAFLQASIQHFDQERLTRAPRATNRDPTPVFIVGMPRSGTTLCEQIIAAHRDAHGAGERNALSGVFARLGGEHDTPQAVAHVAGLDHGALDRAADLYLSELHALAPDKIRIVDKMPANYLYLGLVGLLLPSARVIHCRRDPRDIGLSIFTFRFHGHHPYAHDLADLGWTIAEQERLMTHWKAVLPNPVLTVDLADWVVDFDGTLARVLAFLDLPPDPNCARFHEAESRVRTVSRAQVRQPVNARGLGRWHAYADGLAPLIAELNAAGLTASNDQNLIRED